MQHHLHHGTRFRPVPWNSGGTGPVPVCSNPKPVMKFGFGLGQHKTSIFFLDKNRFRVNREQLPTLGNTRQTLSKCDENLRLLCRNCPLKSSFQMSTNRPLNHLIWLLCKNLLLKRDLIWFRDCPILILFWGGWMDFVLEEGFVFIRI